MRPKQQPVSIPEMASSDEHRAQTPCRVKPRTAVSLLGSKNQETQHYSKDDAGSNPAQSFGLPLIKSHPHWSKKKHK